MAAAAGPADRIAGSEFTTAGLVRTLHPYYYVCAPPATPRSTASFLYGSGSRPSLPISGSNSTLELRSRCSSRISNSACRSREGKSVLFREGTLDSQPNPESRAPDPQAQASAVQPAGSGPFDWIADLVVNSVQSQHSQRAYRRVIEAFIAWYQAQPGRPPLSKALVQQYRVALTEAKLAPSTVNVQLSAIRKLAVEAADNGLLDVDLAAGIAKVKGVKNLGTS
jgi:hypothetical protein